MRKGSFSVVLFGDGLDRLYEAVSFLGATKARGHDGLLFLRGPALAAFVHQRWTPFRIGTRSIPLDFHPQTPDEFLTLLRENDAVRVYACSAWVRLLGLDAARVAERVDAVVGLNAFLSQAEGGPMLSF